MELRHLRYFVAAAEEQNFSRAAAKLFVSQPAVSRQVKDLEEEIGLEMFLRGSGGLELTEAGEIALAQARGILRQSADLLDSMRHLAERRSGTVLKVGFLPTALPQFLTSALRRFRESSPACQVRIFEMYPIQQEEALRDGEIELALIGEPSPSVARDFETAPIFQTELALLLPQDHPLADQASARLSDFQGESFLTLPEENFPRWRELMAEVFSVAGIEPGPMIRSNGLSELLGLIGGGAGVAVAPADLEELPHSGVVFVPMTEPQRQLTFCAAWPKGRPSAPLADFLKAIREESPIA